MLADPAAGSAASSWLAPDEGAGLSALPSVIRDGLSTDESVVACATTPDSPVLNIDKLDWHVQRPDLNGDGVPDWLAASSDDCVTGGGAARWWGWIEAGGGDGPPRVLRVQAEALRVVGARSIDVRQGESVRHYQRAAGPYVQQAPPASTTSAAVVLADFRDSAMSSSAPVSDPQAMAQAQSVFGHQQALQINSVRSGHFTAANRNERLVIVQVDAPRQGQAPAELLRYDGEQLVARYQLTPEQGLFIIGAPDLDGDGRQELLLRADSFQMGITASAATLLRIGEHNIELLQHFASVREDGCEGPKMTRKIRADLIRWLGSPALTAAEGYKRQSFQLPCGHDLPH